MDKYNKSAVVLYVEDETDIREGYTRALQRCAKELFTACDGEEGLNIYKNNNIDIVVSDIKMPKMDGLTMIKEIKKINPDQLIMITSAHSDSESFLEAISLQVDGYLLKPVDKNILKEKVLYFSKQIVMEKEMEKQNILLSQKEKLASMGEMVTNIAHHWRQPLSIISTAASGLQMEKELGSIDDEKFESYVNTILQNTEELSKTIDEFRSFMEVNDEIDYFNIVKVIKKALVIEKQAIDNSVTCISLDLDEELQLKNYQNGLMQSIVSILTNALEAFDINKIEKRYIFISLKKREGDIILSIKDNAGGIEESMAGKLFEAYTTTKHQYVGTGLGLYTTYGLIVDKMKSNIEVKNKVFEYEGEEFKGADFIITLKDYE